RRAGRFEDLPSWRGVDFGRATLMTGRRRYHLATGVAQRRARRLEHASLSGPVHQTLERFELVGSCTAAPTASATTASATAASSVRGRGSPRHDDRGWREGRRCCEDVGTLTFREALHGLIEDGVDGTADTTAPAG